MVNYIDASAEAEAVEVGDGEVGRAVGEAEAPARLQNATKAQFNLMAS